MKYKKKHSKKVKKKVKEKVKEEVKEEDCIIKDGVKFKKPVRFYSRLYQYIYDYQPIDYGGDSQSD